MAGDKYDDLDDLLDDDELQKSIISDAPGKHASVKADEQETPDDQHDKPEADKPTDTGEQTDTDTEKSISELLKNIGLKDDDIEGLYKEFPGARAGGSKKPSDFAETIAETASRVNKTQKSSQSTGDFDESKIMEQLLADLAKGSTDGGSNILESLLGSGDSDGFISSLLTELATKDVLYEPMKDLHTKYPLWLKENSAKLSAEDLARYKQQQSIVAEIVAKFEDPKYSDTNDDARAFISEKMVEMQESGAPPEALVGAGEDIPEMPDCTTQ